MIARGWARTNQYRVLPLSPLARGGHPATITLAIKTTITTEASPIATARIWRLSNEWVIATWVSGVLSSVSRVVLRPEGVLADGAPALDRGRVAVVLRGLDQDAQDDGAVGLTQTGFDDEPAEFDFLAGVAAAFGVSVHARPELEPIEPLRQAAEPIRSCARPGGEIGRRSP